MFDHLHGGLGSKSSGEQLLRFFSLTLFRECVDKMFGQYQQYGRVSVQRRGKHRTCWKLKLAYNQTQAKEIYTDRLSFQELRRVGIY